jgi:hypothetical protein
MVVLFKKFFELQEKRGSYEQGLLLFLAFLALPSLLSLSTLLPDSPLSQPTTKFLMPTMNISF